MDLMKLLFNFDGRIRRTHYWLAAIGVTVAANVLLSLIAAVTGMGNIFLMHAEGAPAFGPSLLVGAPLLIVVLAVVIWTSLALQVKRWHDRDKSWFWVFIAFIPFVGAIWVLSGCWWNAASSMERRGPIDLARLPRESAPRADEAFIPAGWRIDSGCFFESRGSSGWAAG